MSNMWSDTATGMSFTFKMLLIGVSLAIGVFTAMLPSKKWIIVKIEKVTDDNLSTAAAATAVNQPPPNPTNVNATIAAMRIATARNTGKLPINSPKTHYHMTVRNPLQRKDTLE